MKNNILERRLDLPNNERIDLDKSLEIGSESSNQTVANCIKGDFIHPKHAILSPNFLNENQIAITALVPGYPVLINGEPIQVNKPTGLFDGDIIRIGNYDMNIIDHFNTLKKMRGSLKWGVFATAVAMILWVINDYHYACVFTANLEDFEKSIKSPTELNFRDERKSWEKAEDAYKKMIFWGLLDKSRLDNSYKKLDESVIKILIYKELNPYDLTNEEKEVGTKVKYVNRGYKNILSKDLPEFMQHEVEDFFDFDDLISKNKNYNNLSLCEAYLEKMTELKLADLLKEYIDSLKEEISHMETMNYNFQNFNNYE